MVLFTISMPLYQLQYLTKLIGIHPYASDLTFDINLDEERPVM